MTELDDRSRKEPKYGRQKKKHLHSQCLSLRAKRTFHAVLLPPVTYIASSKGFGGQRSKEVQGH